MVGGRASWWLRTANAPRTSRPRTSWRKLGPRQRHCAHENRSESRLSNSDSGYEHARRGRKASQGCLRTHDGAAGDERRSRGAHAGGYGETSTQRIIKGGKLCWAGEGVVFVADGCGWREWVGGWAGVT